MKQVLGDWDSVKRRALKTTECTIKWTSSILKKNTWEKCNFCVFLKAEIFYESNKRKKQKNITYEGTGTSSRVKALYKARILYKSLTTKMF